MTSRTVERTADPLETVDEPGDAQTGLTATVDRTADEADDLSTDVTEGTERLVDRTGTTVDDVTDEVEASAEEVEASTEEVVDRARTTVDGTDEAVIESTGTVVEETLEADETVDPSVEAVDTVLRTASDSAGSLRRVEQSLGGTDGVIEDTTGLTTSTVRSVSAETTGGLVETTNVVTDAVTSTTTVEGVVTSTTKTVEGVGTSAFEIRRVPKVIVDAAEETTRSGAEAFISGDGAVATARETIDSPRETVGASWATATAAPGGHGGTTLQEAGGTVGAPIHREATGREVPGRYPSIEADDPDRDAAGGGGPAAASLVESDASRGIDRPSAEGRTSLGRGAVQGGGSESTAVDHARRSAGETGPSVAARSTASSGAVRVQGVDGEAPIPLETAAAGLLGLVVLGAGLAASGQVPAIAFGGGPAPRIGLQFRTTVGAARGWIGRLPRYFPVPGYSRYDDSDPLSNDHRATVYEAISDSPGVYLSRIGDERDISRSTVRYHVRILEHEGLVTCEKVRGRRRLFPAGVDAVELAAALENDATEAVLRAVARHEPASVSSLATVLDRSPSTVSHHLERLEEDGLVVRRRSGRSVETRLAPGVGNALGDDGQTTEAHISPGRLSSSD